MTSTTQAQETTIVVSSSYLTPSCTPHLDHLRWHVHFEDFEKICGGYDVGRISADALRAFETMTNARNSELRRFDGVPDNYLPHDDDIWIEASGPDVQFWTLNIWDQSTYSFCLREHSEPNRGKSLLELGFLRRRFVAYPGRYMLEPVETTIYLDRVGNPFIIVDNDAGDFIGDSGEPQNAKDAGYTVVRRQYLYCIEKINEALAKLAGVAPPTPMPRWKSLQRVQRRGAAMETTNPTQCDADISAQISAQGVQGDETQDILAQESELCANKHNITYGDLSLDSAENSIRIVELHNNSTVLLSAPWCAETLIALASHFLAVPDPAQCDEEQWLRDWMTPAQWLIEHLADLDCARAWVIIERHVVGMLRGDTWYAKNRARKAMFTLRHVVGFDHDTLRINGEYWNVVEAELNKAQWWPDEHIAYAGPPLFDESTQNEETAHSSYEQGYTAQSAQVVEGTAQTVLTDEQTVHVVEVVAGSLSTEQGVECAGDQVSDDGSAQTLSTAHDEEETERAVRDTEELVSTEHLEIVAGAQGMSRKRMLALMDIIAQERPAIHAEHKEISPGLYLVGIEIALNRWLYFGTIMDWNDPSPQTLLAIDAAERYARQRTAAQSNDAYEDSQGPPGEALVCEEGGEWQ